MDSVTQLVPRSAPDPILAAKLAHPSAVRYIKLGKGGAWTADAIAGGIIPFGFRKIAHAPCVAGDWERVAQELKAAGRTKSGVTQGLRELRDFYDLGDNCLWITFADGHLWWAFAEAEVLPNADDGADGPRRFRRTVDGWHRHSLTGDLLAVRSLSSALTRVAGYRMTICAVEREDYLLRRIRGEEEPLVTEMRALRSQMETAAARMIAGLDWRDFEIMVELIFTRGGWQRQSALGTGEVDIDLLLDNPTTNETAWVQVKSSASQATLDDYLERFHRDGSAQRFYFICHSPKENLSLPPSSQLHLWAGIELAHSALAAGLLDWLIERTR
ncbi:restriction endonuclease [Sphingobium sp. LMC3-1-1.1]|uniref:restriction endonuclease n=1 Tax=Sphingobium sp. LMC3-1-1.1 TaxID=3135241 RepID=UPI0034391B81